MDKLYPKWKPKRGGLRTGAMFYPSCNPSSSIINALAERQPLAKPPDQPPCQLVYEDFYPGYEYRWTTWVDQLDFVTQGKAEITYLQPPALEEKWIATVIPNCFPPFLG